VGAEAVTTTRPQRGQTAVERSSCPGGMSNASPQLGQLVMVRGRWRLREDSALPPA